MTTRPKDLHGLTPETSVRAAIGASDFDRADPFGSTVLVEADLLARWSGVRAKIAQSHNSTAAYPCGLIGINVAELRNLFGHFTGDKFDTAVFFALAHEFGHLVQYDIFGINETFSRPPIEIEGHADVLSGVWLGIRLFQGAPRLPDDVRDATLQLKSGVPDYPTELQRAALVREGLDDSVMLCHLEELIRHHNNYTTVQTSLQPNDVHDLYEISRKILDQR